MDGEFKLIKKIAEILARRYWDGVQAGIHKKDGIYLMSWEQYRNLSLQNWFGAARGIRDLVHKEEKKMKDNIVKKLMKELIKPLDCKGIILESKMGKTDTY
jgi:hypothetical protein